MILRTVCMVHESLRNNNVYSQRNSVTLLTDDRPGRVTSFQSGTYSVTVNYTGPVSSFTTLLSLHMGREDVGASLSDIRMFSPQLYYTNFLLF